MKDSESKVTGNNLKSSNGPIGDRNIKVSGHSKEAVYKVFESSLFQILLISCVIFSIYLHNQALKKKSLTYSGEVIGHQADDFSVLLELKLKEIKSNNSKIAGFPEEEPSE